MTGLLALDTMSPLSHCWVVCEKPRYRPRLLPLRSTIVIIVVIVIIIIVVVVAAAVAFCVGVRKEGETREEVAEWGLLRTVDE